MVKNRPITVSKKIKINKNRNKNKNTNGGKSNVVVSGFASGLPYNTGRGTATKNQETITVSRRVPLGRIAGDGATFVPHEIRLNPGNTELGWLADYARLYETYTIRNLHLSYTSHVSANTNGGIYWCVEPDVKDNAPGSEVDMLSYAQSGQFPVWQPLSVNIMSQSLGTKRYVSKDNLDDDRMGGSGSLYYYCNTSAGTSVGYMYLSYKVTFYTPQTYKLSDIDSLSTAAGGTIGNTGNTYWLIPTQLPAGATPGKVYLVANKILVRLPDANDISNGFAANIPIYSCDNARDHEFECHAWSDDGNASVNQVWAKNQYEYTVTKECDLPFGTTAKFAEFTTPTYGPTSNATVRGFQFYLTDAVTAVTNIALRFLIRYLTSAETAAHAATVAEIAAM